MIRPAMNSLRILSISAALAALLSVSARAEVIPGRWEKVSSLAVAWPITVELKNSDRIRGNYGGLYESDLSLVTHSARAVIPKVEIRTISTRPRDSVANGARMGAAVGAGLVCAIAASFVIAERRAKPMWVLSFTPIGAAVGAGIGAAADAAMNARPIVLYEAPGTR